VNKSQEIALFLLASLAGYVLYRRQQDGAFSFELPDMRGVLDAVTAGATGQFFADLNGGGLKLSGWATPPQGQRYDSIFAEVSSKYKLPAGLLSRIAAKETGNTYRTNLTSRRGAAGLMQLMPANWRKPAPGGGFVPIKPTEDIAGSVQMAGFMLWENFRRYKDWPQAIAAYNSGWAVIDLMKTEAEKKGISWLDELANQAATHPKPEIRSFRAETYNYVTTIAKDLGMLYFGQKAQGLA
jgi:hypothetical protein